MRGGNGGRLDSIEARLGDLFESRVSDFTFHVPYDDDFRLCYALLLPPSYVLSRAISTVPQGVDNRFTGIPSPNRPPRLSRNTTTYCRKVFFCYSLQRL